MVAASTWHDILRPNTLEPDGLAVLPPRLAAEIQATGWRPESDPVRGIEHHRFNFLATDLLQAAGKSVEPFDPPYHNRDHFSAVYEGVRDQLRQRTRGAHPVPAGVRHALLLAAAGHDLGHPGSTFRREAPRGVAAPELEIHISNEMASSILVDRWASRRGVPLGMRVASAQLIDSTTFGVPGKGPTTEWERILVCADIAPQQDFYQWLDSGLNVIYGEVPAESPPADFNGWVDSEIGFLNYVEANLTPEARELGWDLRVDGHRQRLAQIQAGEHPTDRKRMMMGWEHARAGGPSPHHQSPKAEALAARSRHVTLADTLWPRQSNRGVGK